MNRLNAAAGAPILSCVSKGVPGIFMDCHMMVAQPEKVRAQSRNPPSPTPVPAARSWLI